MIRKLIGLPLVCILSVSLCKAQSSNSLSRKWGGNSFGVQLSIDVSTNVITRGSEFTFRCRIKNTSTNNVFYSVTEPKYNFQISISNNSGKTYRLSPDPVSQPIFHNPLMHKLIRGETYEQAIKLKIDEAIPPGNYRLKCRFKFYIRANKSHAEHELESNIIEVELI
jgi:hypothetical protein